MLFILTGPVQLGKTRWLASLIEEMRDRGATAYGVLSPGDWRERPNGETGTEADRGMAGVGRFEKFGIDCVLLPAGERFPFARRADLARAEGVYDEKSQSAQARLGWAIDDRAIARVNEHFERIAAMAGGSAGSSGAQGSRGKGVLVVDELGQLELMRDEGFSSALSLLMRGGTELCGHAVVIVRDVLADLAEERLSPAWGDAVRIGPDDAGRAALFAATGLDA